MNNKQVPDNKKISKTKYLILISIFTTLVISVGVITCIYSNVINTYCDDMYKYDSLPKYEHIYDGLDANVSYPDFEYSDYIDDAKKIQQNRQTVCYTVCGILMIVDIIAIIGLVILNKKAEQKKLPKTKYMVLISIFATIAITIGLLTCIYDNAVLTYANDMEPWGYFMPDNPWNEEAGHFPNLEYMGYIDDIKTDQYYRRIGGYTLCGLFAIADAVVVILLVKTNRKNN